MSRWLLYTIVTMLLWGGWGVLSKPASNVASAWQVQAISTLGLVPILIILLCSKNLWTGRSNRKGLIYGIAGGVIGSLGNVAYFQALAAGGKAAAVTPLTALYPIVTIGLAVTFLRERLNWIQALGAFLSLAAVYCFNVGGDTTILTPWLGLALIPIALWGVTALFQKLASVEGSAELATAAFFIGELPVAVLTPFFVPIDWSLSASNWMLLLGVGLFLGLGNLTLILAYGLGGKASVVTPLSSLYSAVTIPLAVMLLGERVAWREATGIILALAAVVALSWEEQRLEPAVVNEPGS